MDENWPGLRTATPAARPAEGAGAGANWAPARALKVSTAASLSMMQLHQVALVAGQSLDLRLQRNP